MPHYDYRCDACGVDFEAEHAMSARPKLRCPACRSSRTNKVFNAASVQFKTGGFYITDSRPKGQGEKAEKGEKVEAGAGTPAETKAEPAKTDAAAKTESGGKTESTAKKETATSVAAGK